MDYLKVFEKCNELATLSTYGTLDKQDIVGVRFLVIGISPSLIFKEDNIIKFHNAVDNVWNNDTNGKSCDNIKSYNSLYYLSRDTIEKYIVKVIISIHTHGQDKTRNDEELKNQWNEILNKQISEYYVCFPIYGLNVNETTEFGAFKLFNATDYQKFLMENNFSFNEVNTDLNYLMMTISAKDYNRAIELSRPYFELFEYAAKFILHFLPAQKYFDVGIFRYNDWHTFSGYAISKDNFSGIINFEHNGAFENIAVQKLKTLPYAQQIWDLISHHISGENNYMEDCVINAIRCVGTAISENSDLSSYIQCFFAIETLLKFKNREGFITPSVSYKISEYAAFILGENSQPNTVDKKSYRKKIFNDMKELYRTRSRIAHGSIHSINKAELAKVYSFAYKIIFTILQNQELLKLNSDKELQEWIEDKKFM